MRLYHQRPEHRTGAIGPADEEECFTAVGRRIGIWLTSEVLAGADVLSADVQPTEAAPYEVSGDAADHRSFVVPAPICISWALDASDPGLGIDVVPTRSSTAH